MDDYTDPLCPASLFPELGFPGTRAGIRTHVLKIRARCEYIPAGDDYISAAGTCTLNLPSVYASNIDSWGVVSRHDLISAAEKGALTRVD